MKPTNMISVFAANLAIHAPEYAGGFACPLCLRLFPPERWSEIHEEHIIPRSLGGSLCTATCRQCNNQDGTALDAHLVRKQRTDDILAGKSEAPLRAVFTMGAAHFTADVFNLGRPDLPTEIVGIPRLSDPAQTKLASDFGPEPPYHFSIHSKLGYSPRHSKIALLRIAYLMMFRYFGYGYIKYPNAQQVREQIRDPRLDSGFLSGVLSLRELPFPPNTIAISTEPRELQSFVTFLDLGSQAHPYYAVMLPGPQPGALDIYTEMPRHISVGDVSFRGQPIAYLPEHLAEPAARDLLARDWYTATGH